MLELLATVLGRLRGFLNFLWTFESSVIFNRGLVRHGVSPKKRKHKWKWLNGVSGISQNVH